MVFRLRAAIMPLVRFAAAVIVLISAVAPTAFAQCTSDTVYTCVSNGNTHFNAKCKSTLLGGEECINCIQDTIPYCEELSSHDYA
jgi:hypothetical protein